MRKQLKLFITLLTMIALSFLSFPDEQLFPTVNATYMEGPITQDTVWTLVDSPFIISKDVTVYPGATLTIEPEVEVMFGGNSSLIIEGRLVANGAKNKVIKFTSNKQEPEAGDWISIKFNGTQSSSLKYGVIECGTNGIVVENATLNIQNSVISLNSEDGIKIVNGAVEIEYSEIADNAGSGVYIAGGNHVIIQNNTVRSNGDGVTLTGNLTSEINIQQNKILFNRGSGISLEANRYDNTLILSNNLSANYYGFHVLTNASTYVTRNYISNNTVGIFYEKGTNHAAHFNDIYDNNLGMDVSADAVVNATYNYWGDETGPYHESLNPHGKGNPVGGNGVNLDFIFFLTAPIDYNNTFPTAILWTDKTLVAPNQNVTFIGTDSYDDGCVNQYFFDFGDGSNSGWTTLSVFTYNYPLTGTYNAALTVKDDFGDKSDRYAVTISVQNLSPLETSITLSRYTINYNERVSVTVYVSDGASAVENANVTLFSVKGGSFAPLSGLTNSTGHFTTTFVVPNVTEITNVRIIARASKAGYADGSDYKYLKVLPPLKVRVTSEPTMIKSEEPANVAVYVTDVFEQRVAGALLLLSSDHGDLSATTGVTDVNGTATFLFTAPQTTMMLNTTITVNATKSGYMKGKGQIAITVLPKVLTVQVTAQPSATVSELKINVTAHVTYNMVPVSDVNVTVTSENGGYFSENTGLTDVHGNVTFIFTAPSVNEQTNITIKAYAFKVGYADDEELLNVTVNPGILYVMVTVNPSVIESGETAVIEVYVTCNNTPVADALVTVSATNGNFSIINGNTDSKGYCSFVFKAPQTTVQLPIVATANAAKNGFVSAENGTTLTVTPGTLPETGGGFPWTTMLLITIPIAIAVIIVVLIKLKIIVLTYEESGDKHKKW